jgi:hypothetical protein
MKKPKAAVVAAAILASVLSSCSQAVDHSIAGGIKNALPASIGPSQNYDVTVKSNPLDAAKGHLNEVDIVGTGVNLSPQLLIEQLDVQATDIDADVTTRKVKSVGQVLFAAVIGQDSIDHYIAALPPSSPQRQEQLAVVLNNNSVTATVLVKALGLSVPASVTGFFVVEPANPKYIDFIPDKGSLSVIPVPQFALKLALTRINPVIDLTTSTVPVTVSSVTIQAGKLTLRGQADLQHGLVKNT